MRVLITGATGFVGGYLIRHLRDIAPDTEIVGTVHDGHSIPDTRGADIRYVPCDITANQGEDIRALIEEAQPNHLYHLAGAASGAARDREAVFRVNVTGTANVMSAAAREAPLCRILFASTGYVYGPCDPDRPAGENDPLQPVGLYAESKRDAEPFARDAGAIIARAFNHTGPEQTTAFAIPAFAEQIARIEKGQQEAEMRVGNLEAQRDFLDVRDVVRAYHLLMEQGESGEVYNACSGEALAMSSILDSLLALSDRPIAVTSDPARMRPSDLPVSVGDPSNLRVRTGWQPEIPFAQTLRDTLDWWRSRV